MPCTTAEVPRAGPPDRVNVDEAPRAPMACISSGHQASTATSTAARAIGPRQRRQPARRPSTPIDRAATSATRASAVTEPLVLGQPGHQDQDGGGGAGRRGPTGTGARRRWRRPRPGTRSGSA